MPVLIVDDHPGFRAAAAAVAGSCPGFTVAGELATGEQAAGRIGSAGAALVLMDIGMPGIGGAEADPADPGQPSAGGDRAAVRGRGR